MDYRLQNRQRRGINEAGPSSSFQARNRNDNFVKHSSYREVSATGQITINNHPKRWLPKDDRDGRQSKGIYQTHSRSNSVSSDCSSLRLIESGKSRPYVCPNCKHPYHYFLSNNTICGKVPRILPCKHTVCEECIKKCMKTTNHIQCKICLKSEFDKKQLCEYNHYVLGQLTCSRFNKSLLDISNIALVSTDSKSRLSLTSHKQVCPSEQKEKCGFKDCMNSGVVSCVDCCGIYCKNCDDALHRSGKQLRSHKRVPINKVAVYELSKCSEHPMFEDIYCNDCDETSCCYCVLEKHEGHSRTYLARLGKDEENELMKAYNTAELKRKHLLISQKKILGSEQSDMESDLEIEIAQKFADIHAQLYFIEKQLYEEAKLLKNGHSDLMELNETIKLDIERLNYMMHCVDQRQTVKVNLRMLLSNLKEIENLPTVLVSSENSRPPKLVIDEQIDDLNKFFKIDIPDKVTFSLMDVEQLPQEYQEDIEIPNVKTSQSKSSSDSDISRNIRPKQILGTQEIDKYKQTPVFVTHINSLDSFYVQFKEEGHLYEQLEKELKNHMSRMKPGVNAVELKELYLARRVCDQNRWCRVLVLEEIDGEYKYKVKFIDFGNVTVVTKDEMMFVSSSLAKRRPFAYECKLYNPASFEWPKDTHLELAKLLDINKELVMYTKEHSNNIYTVELNITTSAGGLCSVTDLLIFGCDALRKKPVSEPPIVFKIYDNSDVYVVGHSYDVFIKYISDPWHVYVQRTSYQDTFDNLVKNMEGFYNNSECDIHLPIRNSYVVIYHKIKDFGNWHRAKILDVFKNTKVVNVYLLDLGKSLRVPWKDTRKLSHLFIKSEYLVVCAKMADVAPLVVDTWSNSDEFEVRKFWDEYSKKNMRMKMLVSETNPLEAVLFHPQESYDVNINALLVEKNLARSTGKLSCTKMWIHKEEEAKTEDNNVLFFKDDSEDEEIEDKIPGVKLQVEIVKFENPSSFYVAFVSKKKLAEKLNEELQIHFKSQKNVKTDRIWDVNEKVVAFDSSDKMYYRGIISMKEGNKYCVNLLDKPDYLWVDSGKLRSIPDYFVTNFPNTVFKCHLANIKAAGDSNKWSKLSIEWFEMLFKKHEEIFMKKTGDDKTRSSIPVTMWYSKIIQGTALEPSYRNYVSIDKKVVKAGLAFWVNNEVSRINLPVTEEPTTSKQADSNLNENDMFSDVTNETTDSSETVVPSTSKEIKTNNILEWEPAARLTSEEFYAYITCAENEGYLFIREERIQAVYEEMERKITSHFNDISKADNFVLKENQMVMVRSEGRWYRGFVLKVLDKNTAQIMMIDFGSDHIVNLKDLHNKIMYPEIPIMVSRVKLFNVQSKNKTWTDEEVGVLLNIAPAYAHVIVRSSLHDSIPLADVYDTFDGVCLNDELVKLCPNLYRSKLNIPPTKSVNVVSPKKHGKLENEEQIEMEDVKVREDKDVTEADYEENINEGIKENEQEVINNEEEHTNENAKEQINEDAEEPTYEDAKDELHEEAIKEVEKKSSNETKKEDSDWYTMVEKSIEKYTYAAIEKKMLEMEIIAVYDHETISLYHPDDDSTEREFEILTNSIRSNVEDSKCLEDIKIGMPCLSLFEEDNEWYRAKIIRMDAEECGYVTVIYVDYGNFEIVKTSNLRTMRPEWLCFPARYIEASIAYSLLKKDQENVLLKHARSLCGETRFIKVVKNDPLLVHVYNKIGDIFELHYDAFVRNGIVEI